MVLSGLGPGSLGIGALLLILTKKRAAEWAVEDVL